MKKLLIAMVFVLSLFSFASADKLDDAISWMYDNGLTIHAGQMTYKADSGLRRDEAAKFYVNFSKLLGKTTYVRTASQCVFSDINDSWSDLKDIVVESCRLGLFQGSKGKFNPTNQLTNAQAITLLVRLLAGNQSEVGLSHRANNYYTKANELGILQNVNMNSKDSVATRGNVGIIIYNGNEKVSNCLNLKPVIQKEFDWLNTLDCAKENIPCDGMAVEMKLIDIFYSSKNNTCYMAQERLGVEEINYYEIYAIQAAQDGYNYITKAGSNNPEPVFNNVCVSEDLFSRSSYPSDFSGNETEQNQQREAAKKEAVCDYVAPKLESELRNEIMKLK